MHVVESLSADHRNQIVEAAVSCIGTPFHLNQRQKFVGMDCAGLLWQVIADCGFWEPEYLTYSRQHAYGMRVYEHLRVNMDEIPVDKMQNGSVFLFWIRTKKIPQHIAIKHEQRMIHAYPEARGVVRTGLGPYWTKRIFTAFDFRVIVEPNHRVAKHALSTGELTNGVTSARSRWSGNQSGSGCDRSSSGSSDRHAGAQRDSTVTAANTATPRYSTASRRR